MDDIYTRCMICKIKILREISVCKCKDRFCRKHMFEHKCNYEYKNDKIILDKVITDKVIRI